MTDWNMYYKMIVKKKMLIIIITVVFILIASYVSFFMVKPQYEASTRLFVLMNSQENNKQITYEQLMSAQLFIKNYNELIKSRAVTSEVINKFNLTGMTDDELASRISVDLLPDSSMMLITVEYEDPALVVAIANEVSNVFILKASEILMHNNVNLVDKAVAIDKPAYSKTFMIIGFGFLAGIMLSQALILVLVYFDDTIGDSKEVEKKTGLHVYGIIPDMKIR